MFSDSFRSKAVGLAASVARKAAASLDEFAAKQPVSQVVYLPTMHFEQVRTGNHVRLKYPLKGLAIEELSVTHSQRFVYLTVRPVNSEFVIGSIDKLVNRGVDLSDDRKVSELAALKWGSVTEAQLKQIFFACGPCDGDLWAARAASLAALLLAVAVDLRREGQEGLRSGDIKRLYDLDELVRVAVWSGKSDSISERLDKFLQDLPGFEREDILKGKLQDSSYEHYGYLTMQLDRLFSTPEYARTVRTHRLGGAVIEYASREPIRSVSAAVDGDFLLLDVIPAESRLTVVKIDN